MNKSLAFTGREKEIGRLQRLYSKRQHAVIVGPAGIGKTALVRQIRQSCPMLLCEETSSLRRICDGLERQLGWRHYKMNVVERKNRLLAYLERRGELVTLDHVALTPPRVARFVAHLTERIPVWIVCRSTLADEVGNVWQYLYQFERVEVPPLPLADASLLINAAAAQGNVQPEVRECIAQIYKLSRGVPRILEELLIELATRRYKMGTSFGLDLLDLDRQIQEISTSIQAQRSGV